MLRERVGEIEILRLNRPEKRNALDTATLDLLNADLEELATDPRLRVLVVSTTNVRALCAGADVGEPLDHDGGVRRMVGFTRMYSLIEQFPVPTIAVAVGNCVGAGAELVAGVDLRVGGDNLGLAWAGARLGVPVGPARLAPLIGVSRAKELVFTGRVLRMADAEALGLLHRTAPADEAEAVAIELAGQIVAQSADGVRELKQMFRELDSGAQRVSYENDRLLAFQQHGSGLPRG
ncbi:MAG: enoyl-CoA hydratase/isomerase family protein [Jatrophihabitans sp.]|nr:enoyl-CoA hydratase/isomerase family protein [Jatrophihabitans sp.]